MYRNNIKEKRTELKMTQEELARIVDVSNACIYKIENGKQDTTIQLAHRIKKALQCKSLEELFPEQ